MRFKAKLVNKGTRMTVETAPLARAFSPILQSLLTVTTSVAFDVVVVVAAAMLVTRLDLDASDGGFRK